MFDKKKYTDNYWAHTPAAYIQSTTGLIRQHKSFYLTQKKNETKRKHIWNTLICIHQLHVRSFGLLWLPSHLWLFVSLAAERHDFHTQTRSAVINSITHTSVNTNEAKTNKFLFMFCLHFTKRAFFFPFFLNQWKHRHHRLQEQHLQRANLLAAFNHFCVLLSVYVKSFSFSVFTSSVSLCVVSFTLFFFCFPLFF